MTSLTAWLLVLTPAASGLMLISGGVAARNRWDPWAAPVAVTVAAVTAAVAVVVAIMRPAVELPFVAHLPFQVRVDGLSAAMVITVGVVTALVVGYAAAEFRAETDRGRGQSRARFFGLLLGFSAAMQLTVVASGLPALLLGWELMGATSYALVGFWWQDTHRTASATTAFLTTRAADLGLYLAAGAAVAGSSMPARGGFESLPMLSGGMRDIAAAGLLVAAAGKSAQLPFSFWLSRAMDGPSPVSALLHSATMVAAGSYLVLRAAPLFEATTWATHVVAWLGAATAVTLGVTALLQTDIKQLLAASTCAQMGFVFLAAGSGALAGGALQLIAHAATKALLFLVAGMWLQALGTRSLPALAGAGRWRRGTGVLMVAGALGLAGLPPWALWPAKDAALAAAAENDVPLYVAGLIGAALSAAYSMRLLGTVLRPVPASSDQRYDTAQQGTRRVTSGMLGPAGVLAVAAVGLVAVGVPPLLGRVRPGLGVDGAGPAATTSGLLLSAVVAAVVAAAVTVRVRRGAAVRVPAVLRPAQRWWGLEQGAHRWVVRPCLAMARAAARTDRGLDRATERLGRATLQLAGRTRRVGETGTNNVVDLVAATFRALGRQARRPQTGQLHQYYAQALVAVAVVVVVVLVVR